MKIKSVNNDLKKYGYPIEMEYNNHNFNGHQIGVAVCIKNNVTGLIEENFLSESLGDKASRDSLLSELLADENVTLIPDIITQFDRENGGLIPKTIYYIPYVVENHSRFIPTVTNDNIVDSCNASYDVKIELLFTEEEVSRYLVIPFKTRNISVMDLVYNLFEGDREDLKEVGIEWQDGSDDTEAGYTLDFYTNTGERYNLVFSNGERLRDAIASMRLIDIVCHIDGEDEEDGNKSE